MSAPTALELLWGSPQRPRRGPKPSLSLERIVAAAIELADAEGLANLSMQRLAERLGCAKMALYRYVPGKAELIALMIDAAIGAPPELSARQGDSSEEPWRARLRLWTLRLHEGMLGHPWVLEVTLGIRPFGPNEMAWTESALTALADTALDGAERLDAVALLAGHARTIAQQSANTDTGNLEAEMARQFSDSLATRAADFPQVIAAFAESGPPQARNNALDFGIDRILDGLAALTARR
ncbi:TetR/AcrR family transcriptional regulator [Nocardia sp. NPDC051570]|uniref:TetR/AcrR family transcriptional regulator n=1 Tax=Nocardia sp. NPDC051570 TaxID=3364324 RepID=UPI00379C91A5